MQKTNAFIKSNELTSVSNIHLEGKINFTQLKLISHFIIALCKVLKITFEKQANAFNTQSDASLT